MTKHNNWLLLLRAVVPFIVCSFFLGHVCHGFTATTTTGGGGGGVVVVVMPHPCLGSSRHDRVVARMLPSTASRLCLFGGLSGSDETDNKNENEPLAVYSNFSTQQFEGLAEYVQQWAMTLFGKDKKGGISLTTPVTVRPVTHTDSAKGVQILFCKVQTGYQDKDQEKYKDDAASSTANEEPKKKKKEVKQGGVEILVEKVVGDDNAVQVRAKRCEMDEDTMIKEMSEEVILKELKKAMDVWKKQQQQL